MEITKHNYDALISAFSINKKNYFYEKLAHNLTISCRDIWSNKSLTDCEKIEQMKWLNEIQHRIVAKISVTRLNSHEWKESDIIQMIGGYVKLCSDLRSEVGWAINASYKTTLNYFYEKEK